MSVGMAICLWWMSIRVVGLRFPRNALSRAIGIGVDRAGDHGGHYEMQCLTGHLQISCHLIELLACIFKVVKNSVMTGDDAILGFVPDSGSLP